MSPDDVVYSIVEAKETPATTTTSTSTESNTSHSDMEQESKSDENEAENNDLIFHRREFIYILLGSLLGLLVIVVVGIIVFFKGKFVVSYD
jgi:hypothetical protein